MDKEFSWLKEIKKIKNNEINVNKLQENINSQRIKGYELELLARNLDKVKDLNFLEKIKIAIISDNASQPIANALKLACFCENYLAFIYESPIGAAKQEIINTKSSLYKFNPDIVFIDVSYRSIENMPNSQLTEIQINNKLQKEIKIFEILWNNLLNNLNVQIIQNTIVTPSIVYRDLSERQLYWSPINFIETLNKELIKASSSNVTWLDLHKLATLVGLVNWQDKRLFHKVKYGFATEFLPEYTTWVRSCIRSITANFFKVLVVDLDNTLWGGIIGDDGIDGIYLGPDTPEGSCFLEFCEYILSLKKRGVILGICSKNELSNITEVFNNHPHMPLSLDDFSSIKCNWHSKVQNLSEMALELNIDESSIVFIDDNPAECELVRQKIPKIMTINLSEDPSENLLKLDLLNLFKIEKLTNEDFNRSESYIAKNKSDFEKNNFIDISEYLFSLKMNCIFENSEEKHLQRIEQMQLKTNQFNLCTNRYKINTLREKLLDENISIFSIKLKDKFADHGFISYLEYEKRLNSIYIKDWLISCRVFSRTLEEFILKNICKFSENENIDQIFLRFIESKKNSFLKNRLKELNFKITSKEKDIEIWSAPITKIIDLKTYIN